MQHPIWHVNDRDWHVSCSMFLGIGYHAVCVWCPVEHSSRLLSPFCYWSVCSMVEVLHLIRWGAREGKCRLTSERSWPYLRNEAVTFFTQRGGSSLLLPVYYRGDVWGLSEPRRWIVTFDWLLWLLGGGLYASLKPSLLLPPVINHVETDSASLPLLHLHELFKALPPYPWWERACRGLLKTHL